MRVASHVVIVPAARELPEAPPSAARLGAAAPGGGPVVTLSRMGAAFAEPRPARVTTARLQAIRSMLDQGAYPVDLDVLAARLVDDGLLRAGR